MVGVPIPSCQKAGGWGGGGVEWCAPVPRRTAGAGWCRHRRHPDHCRLRGAHSTGVVGTSIRATPAAVSAGGGSGNAWARSAPTELGGRGLGSGGVAATRLAPPFPRPAFLWIHSRRRPGTPLVTVYRQRQRRGSLVGRHAASRSPSLCCCCVGGLVGRDTSSVRRSERCGRRPWWQLDPVPCARWWSAAV